MLAQPAAPLAAISSAPAKPSLSPPHSHLHKTAVAAGTVGGIIGAIVALVLMLLVLRWHKRHNGENLETIKHESEVQVQSLDANGTGSSFNGSGKSRDLTHLPAKLSQQGTSKRYLDDYIILSFTWYQALLVLFSAATCSEPCRQANRFA